MELELQPISEEKRVLRVYADRKEIKPGKLVIESKYGRLQLGLRPEGFHGWVFRDTDGGGAITIPYAIDRAGEVYVGMIREDRANMGPEPVWCAIGGITTAGEAKHSVQAREAAEESGLDTTAAFRLAGKPFVGDRLYFVADVSRDEGVDAFALELPFSALVRDEVGMRLEGVKLNAKRESEMRFFPAHVALCISADTYMVAGIARLLVHLSQI